MPTPADADELKRREDALAAREAAFAEKRTKTRKAEDEAFVTSVVQSGRLPKVLQASACALFAELDDDDTISFGEGEDAKTSTPRAAFRDLLSALPKPVTEGEIAKGDFAAEFSEPATVTAAIKEEVKRAKDAGEDISPATAMDRIQRRAKG